MKYTSAILAALAVLASAGHVAGPAFADRTKDTSTGTAAQSDAKEPSKDHDPLKSLEQGFSIPAADGASSKSDTQKKGAGKK